MGSFAWLAQAVLWCAFRVFQPSDVITLFPIAVLIALAAQWRKTTWIGIVAHGILNAPPLVILVRMIA
ncbi:MAG: CPBP family intramembrane metalloprotease [Alphaproteobacteria bacterium]|nr:CPBP family intramembrane metalloprotease [Alphaproteobacteria bacterium]